MRLRNLVAGLSLFGASCAEQAAAPPPPVAPPAPVATESSSNVTRVEIRTTNAEGEIGRMLADVGNMMDDAFGVPPSTYYVPVPQPQPVRPAPSATLSGLCPGVAIVGAIPNLQVTIWGQKVCDVAFNRAGNAVSARCAGQQTQPDGREAFVSTEITSTDKRSLGLAPGCSLDMTP